MRDVIAALTFFAPIVLFVVIGLTAGEDIVMPGHVFLAGLAGVVLGYYVPHHLLFTRLWPRKEFEPEPIQPYVYSPLPNYEEIPIVVTAKSDQGTHEFTGLDALLEHFEELRRETRDESWLDLEHSHAPQYGLFLCWSGGYFHLWFTPAEDSGHPGFFALADPIADPELEIHFVANDATITAEHLLNQAQAIAAIRSFYERPDLPPNLRWEDLLESI